MDPDGDFASHCFHSSSYLELLAVLFNYNFVDLTLQSHHIRQSNGTLIGVLHCGRNRKSESYGTVIGLVGY